MVLAAGEGRRLLPVTDERPKPAWPVLGEPLVGFALRMVRRLGVTRTAMNVFHLAEAVERTVGDGSRWGMQEVWYAREQALMGTGGGLKAAQGFIESDDDSTFVLVNGDIAADFDLTDIVAQHKARGAAATMVLTRRGAAANPESLVHVDDEQRVVRISHKLDTGGIGVDAGMFTGIHILEREVFEYMPPLMSFCINEYTYPRLVADGRPVFGVFADGYWSDLGTFPRYVEAVRAFLDGRERAGGLDPLAAYPVQEGRRETVVALGEGVRADAGARFVGPCAVGAGARIGADAVIGPYAVVGAGAVVGRGAVVERTIVFDNVRVAADERLFDRVASAAHRVPVALP